MSLPVLADAIDAMRPELLSTDLFDTVLLRDHSIESTRLATACRRAAGRVGVDPTALTRLRWTAHELAYRSVAMERPDGEAVLADIWRVVATGLGLDEDAAGLMHRTEVDVDISHLRPQRSLLDLLDQASQDGIRVVAVSDTYYCRNDLERMLGAVVGTHPILTVYASSELGQTKHSGGIFAEVARRENISPVQILHLGDDLLADVQRPRTAGWSAVHLPRARRHRASKLVGKLASVPTKLRRAR